MEFKDFDIETQDERGNIPEHFNGSVATAGSPVTITPSSGKITSFVVDNPDKGTNANDRTDLLLVSLDGGTTFKTVKRGTSLSGESLYLDDLRIDSNANSTNYEIIITHD